MSTLLRACLIGALLSCYIVSSSDSKHAKVKKGEELQSHAASCKGGSQAATPERKVTRKGIQKIPKEPGCRKLGGICQLKRFVCQGRYLNDRCSGPKTRGCCMPVGAWSVLCAGHHNNRVRACDAHGCGAFNSKRGYGRHKAVDVVCDDYAVVNAPFSGNLAGPVSWRDQNGEHYDGVKFLNDVHCVKIFNIRPYLYTGPVSQGQALGYVLPLQDRFSGITSHLQLQMCDGTDPSPFI